MGIMTSQEEYKWRALESLAKFAIIAGAMFFNASNFDKTEIMALVMIAVGVSGVDGIKKVVSSGK